MPSRDSDALRTLGLTAARWHAILDTAQDAIICIAASGEITLFNPARSACSGTPPRRCWGRTSGC